jgi:hypothetical protein
VGDLLLAQAMSAEKRKKLADSLKGKTPHPHATTYQAPMSHAWADGRLFIRGGDALYCYDLRR